MGFLGDLLGAHGFCLCGITPWLDVAMIVTLCVLILAGYPVAFSLAGTALIFAALGLSFGVFDIGYIRPLPQRIYGAVTNTTLIAVPMFILMGVILEKAKIAEELLDEMSKLFGTRAEYTKNSSGPSARFARQTGNGRPFESKVGMGATR